MKHIFLSIFLTCALLGPTQLHATGSDSFDAVDSGDDAEETSGESESFSQETATEDNTMESETYSMTAEEESDTATTSVVSGGGGARVSATNGSRDERADDVAMAAWQAASEESLALPPPPVSNMKRSYLRPANRAQPFEVDFTISVPHAAARTKSAGAQSALELSDSLHYFNAIEECGFSCRNRESVMLALQAGILGGLIAAGFSGSLLGGIHLFRRMRRRKAHRFVWGFLVLFLFIVLPRAGRAENISVPTLRVYNGTLFGVNGKAITTPVTIRFSYWSSVDFLSTDKTATGAINAGNLDYMHWQETRTVTPNAKGAFSVMLGQQTSLLNLKSVSNQRLTNLSLQVEVKPSTSPDTAYELLDVNRADAAVDRSRVSTTFFAKNADLLDQHDTGTGTDDIPYLEFGGKLPISTIPEGTHAGTFTLDADDSQTTQISLSFGTALQRKLSYDFPSDMFIFNNDLKVEGNLTVTGLINGIDLEDLAAGVVERKITTTFTPEYEKAVFQGDGADNVGQLSVSYDNAGQKNFYLWTSTRPTLQDYDILLTVPVSTEFQSWQTGTVNPITFAYRSTSANAADNKIDIQVYDTSGEPVTLSGASTNLKSTSWATTQLEFTGTPVWTPGQDMLVRIKVFARSMSAMHVGTLKFSTVERAGQ